MKAGLIGHPVAQSKSPIIHEYWMKQFNIEGKYELFDVEDMHLEALVKQLVTQGYDGFNVTVPHKENIIPLCKTIDSNAKKIGAVNMVHIQDGALYGYNTDVAGFIQNLKQSIIDFNMTGKTALVLGAGGAARAVIQGLKNEGINKIYLTNRTREKADILQQNFGSNVEVIDWDERESKNNEINLLVNTTSLGMVNKPSLIFDLNGLKKDAIVHDIIYNPLMTDLLRQAEERGLKVITGIGMLLYQAAPSFALWTGITPSVTLDLTNLVLR